MYGIHQRQTLGNPKTPSGEVLHSILKDNCGTCRAENLIQRGAYYGFTVSELRQASVCLGVVGTTINGQRYIALPSHAKQLEPGAQYHASVVRYHRTEAEKERQCDTIELDDDLPNLE